MNYSAVHLKLIQYCKSTIFQLKNVFKLYKCKKNYTNARMRRIIVISLCHL